MGYVRSSGPDIFVSYTHVNNQAADGPPGWVDQFVTRLKFALAQKLPRRDPFRIWIDQGLRGNEPVTAEIEKALQGAAVLVVVLSGAYLDSTWCRDELDLFRKVIAGRPRDQWRIFVVMYERVVELPQELRDRNGYRFYHEPANGPSSMPLKPNGSTEEPYEREIHRLAEDLAHELKELRQVADRLSTSRPDLAPSKPVFLAYATDELNEDRDRVANFLTRNGVGVLPESLDVGDEQKFREAITRDLARSGLFVQLLSRSIPKRPGFSKSFVAIQHECAESTPRLKRMLWRDTGLDLTKVTDPALLTLLRSPHLMTESLEDFQDEVLKAVRELTKAEEARRHRTGESVHAKVFVHWDRPDEDLAKDVIKALKLQGKVDLIKPIPGLPTLAERLEDLRENVYHCDGMLLIFGESHSLWAKSQILYSHEEIRRKRKRRPPVIGIYEGPPPDVPRELGIELDGITIVPINCRGERRPNEMELRKFLDATRKRHCS
jgi:hypothetical protein